MNHNKQDLKYKKYKFFLNSLHKIQEEIRKIPWTQLEKPVHSGYEIYFDFRDDIKNQEDFENLQKAFDLVSDYKIVYSKENARRICSKEVKFLFEEKFYLTKDYHNLPKINTIKKSTYDSLEPDIKKYFKRILTKQSKNNYLEIYILEIRSYQLLYRFRKHFKTKIKNVPEELKNEEIRLKDKIWYSDEYKDCWSHKSKKKWKVIKNQKYRSLERDSLKKDEIETPVFKKSIKWEIF